MTLEKRSIFAVDDEKDILDIYYTALGKDFSFKGFLNVNEFVNEFIDAIQKNQLPDIIFTDLRMPEMSGIQLIKWTREKNIFRPFLVISGFADRTASHEAMKLGMVEILEKPFSADQLRVMTERVLSFV